MPIDGQTITFSKIPPGSCSEGVRYRVERPRNKGDFRFVNVERGSSTFDRPWAVKMASWAAS